MMRCETLREPIHILSHVNNFNDGSSPTQHISTYQIVLCNSPFRVLVDVARNVGPELRKMALLEGGMGSPPKENELGGDGVFLKLVFLKADFHCTISR